MGRVLALGLAAGAGGLLALSQGRARWGLIGLLLCGLSWPLTAPQSARSDAWTSEFLDGQAPPAGLLARVPERDLARLTLLLLPTQDSFATYAQGAALRAQLHEVSDAPPSALPLALSAALQGEDPRPHLYALWPEGEGPFPVLLFFHGGGGNLQQNLEALRPLTQAGVAVVAPSFGLGLWARDTDQAERALAWIDAQPRLDTSRVVGLGLGTGAMGLSRLVRSQPQRFAGLLFLSPALPPEEAGLVVEQLKPLGTPVVLLSGQKDQRAPYFYVEQAAELLLESGLPFRLTAPPQADHSLLWTQPQLVHDALRTLFAAIPGAVRE